MSLARKHFERVSAGLSPPSDAAETPVKSRMLSMLAAHAAALKGIQSTARKIEAKRQMLPEYAAYIDGLIDTDKGGDDEVAVMVLVWRVDVGDWDAALPLADYALRHKLSLPARFKRDLPALLVEEPAEHILKELAAGASADTLAAAVEALDELMDMTISHDMHDQVRAKGFKALGLARRESSPQDALICLKSAFEHDGSCGVKTEIARLERQLAAPPEPTDPPPAETGG